MMECRDCGWSFTEERGFMIHGLNGGLIIPVLGLVLLIVAFLTVTIRCAAEGCGTLACACAVTNRVNTASSSCSTTIPSVAIQALTRDKMLVRWGAITFALVIIQSQLLAPLGREYPSLGALHGANALLLLAAAVVAWHRARTPAPASEPAMAT